MTGLFNRTCPVCGRGLANSAMGVNSHLRMHIRNTELASKDELVTRLKVLGQKFRPASQPAAVVS